MEKSADAFRTISEVAEDLKLPQHVLRFWETRFPQVRPLKRGGNRRFYRPDDVELLRAIKILLYGDGFTIKGVQRILKERGPRAVASLAQPEGRDGVMRDISSSPRRGDDEAETSSEDYDPADDVFGEKQSLFDDLAASPDAIERLQAVLFELSECRRILNAVRE